MSEHVIVASDWTVLESALPAGVQGIAWLHPDDGAPCVAYSDKLTDKERRMTIAHEIAHLVFDRGNRVRSPEMEARADRFAAELVALMLPAKRSTKAKQSKSRKVT